MLFFAMAAALVTAADIEAIRKKCNAPAEMVQLQSDGAVQISPIGPDFKKLDCILASMKEIAIKQGAWPRMGFLGNEAPG